MAIFALALGIACWAILLTRLPAAVARLPLLNYAAVACLIIQSPIQTRARRRQTRNHCDLALLPRACEGSASYSSSNNLSTWRHKRGKKKKIINWLILSRINIIYELFVGRYRLLLFFRFWRNLDQQCEITVLKDAWLLPNWWNTLSCVILNSHIFY